MPLSDADSTIAPFAAVVFDMDGTILDTELVFRSVVFDVARDLGFEMTDAVHLAMVGASHEVTRRLLAETYGAHFPFDLFETRCRALSEERLAEAVPVKTGARELLGELRARGIPAAVATSSRARYALGSLGRAGLVELFAAIVTREDVVNPKPHPEPYLTAARRLRIEPGRCLAIEDSHAGVRAAHAAGMQTVMVPDLLHPTDEIAALCVAVMESLAHVHSLAFPIPVGEAETTGVGADRGLVAIRQLCSGNDSPG